jgi:hypothetical protein
VKRSASCHHVIYQQDAPLPHPFRTRYSEGACHILPPLCGIEMRLCLGLADAHQRLLIKATVNALRKLLRKKRCLIVCALTLPSRKERHWKNHIDCRGCEMRLHCALQHVAEILFHPERMIVFEGVNLVLKRSPEIGRCARPIKCWLMCTASAAHKRVRHSAFTRMPANRAFAHAIKERYRAQAIPAPVPFFTV